MYADIDTRTRRAIYARDGYRCALCDNSSNLQVHHYLKRSNGGSNSHHNLICLCSTCHAQAHGVNMYDSPEFTESFIEQAVIEYLADYYAPDWNPWRRE